MGRKPLATEVKKQKGSFIVQPGRENKLEPKPPKGWPEKTELVLSDPLASQKWDETCQLLEKMMVLSKADRDLLELFCMNYSQYIALLRKVQKSGIVGEMLNHRGEVVLKRSPYQAELSRITDRQAKLLAEFGLTPSSRSRIVTVGDKKPESSFDKWIERGG